jgi:hypothetical protein
MKNDHHRYDRREADWLFAYREFTQGAQHISASKTVALEFVDSVSKAKLSLSASRLSVLKDSDLAPKALLQLQPGASPQGFDYAMTSAESALQSARRIERVLE